MFIRVSPFKIVYSFGGMRRTISAGPGRVTRMAVIERFGGCCHGQSFFELVDREKVKSRINTVTEILSKKIIN